MSVGLGNQIMEAYRMLGDATPLPVDCGRLCGGACCHGGGEMGMLLFPGEMALLSHVEDFRMFRIPYMGGRAWHLTCDGTCNRMQRPLSCRIFPLAPRVGEDGKVTQRPDPRAGAICPLANGEHLDYRFIKRVEELFAYLSGEPKMMEFMARLSRELDELENFHRKVLSQ